jgi:hypothetical protein
MVFQQNQDSRNSILKYLYLESLDSTPKSLDIPGLTDDPERVRHHHLQHVDFGFRTIDELLGTYVRLKASGIVPVLPVDEGSHRSASSAEPR